MDISRLKKVLAGISVAAISLTQAGTVFAAYSDVAAGVWYEEAVGAFVDAGYLDANQTKFRGADKANRAEFVKLVVELNGGILAAPPAVQDFDDVAKSAWYYGYFAEAGKEGWVRGDKDCYGSRPCYARPAANINRAEAASLIVRAFSLEATGDAPQFVDNPSGQWYTESIQTAADHCVLQGDDSTGRVRPSDNMNRAEMVVMLHRVDQGLTYGVDCGTAEEEPVSGAPAIDGVTTTATNKVILSFTADLDQTTAEDVKNYKVTAGTKEVKVTSSTLASDRTVELTLGEEMDAATEYTVTVSNVTTADGDGISDSATFKGYSAVVKTDSTLEVALSSKNPVGDSVPKGGVGVTMLSLDVTASCKDSVTVEDITVLHEGFGATGDIDGLYAMMNGFRISRKRTIDSKDQSATVHLTTPLAVAACKTATLDLVADISTTAVTAAEHNLVVELPSDFQSNAKSISGNFPLRGNTFKIAAVTSGQVSIAYRTVTPNEVDVGDKAGLVGKFEINTNNVEDQTVYSMTMENNGTLKDADAINFSARRSDGTVITNVVSTTKGGFATFVFDPPFIIKQGDKITLNIVADLVGGAGDTLIMHFEESSDIFAVGSLYGYGVNGQLYGSNVALPATETNLTTVTVRAGEFTIQIDGPPQQSYTRDQDDAVLANVIFTTGGEKIDMRKLFIAVQAKTSTGANMTNRNSTAYDDIIELVENVSLKNTKTGRAIDAVRLKTDGTDFDNNSTTGGTYQIYRFDDFTVNGKENWQLLVDFIDNTASNSPRNGDTFTVHICGEPKTVSTGDNTAKCFSGLISTGSTAYQMTVEGISTGDAVTDVRPGGTVTGNAQRIADATLTVAVKSIGEIDNVVKNSKNVNLMRIEARAGEAKDILLTKAVFKSASGSLNNGQNYTLWVDTDGNAVVDTILEKGVSAQNSKITFTKLTGGGFVIPKEKTVTFEIHSDISASLTNTWLQLQFDTTGTQSTEDFLSAEDVVRGSSLSGLKVNAQTCSSCDIIITTVASQIYKLLSSGDLFVTKDTTPLRSRQLLGGVLADPVMRLNFRAENEAIDVTDLQINSSGSLADSIESLELYKDGVATKFATATIGGCGSDDVLHGNNGTTNPATKTFCVEMGSRQLVVPEGAELDVLVRPRIKTDIDGAVSGSGLAFFITSQAVVNYATGSGAIRARGDESSNNLNRNAGNSGTSSGTVFIGRATSGGANADIVGLKNIVVLAKISAITNANPDANGTNVPTGVADVGQFKFTAAANGNTNNGTNKAVLSGVVFNVIATNVIMNGSNFKFFNKANSTVTTSCVSLLTSGTFNTSTNLNSASGSFLVKCMSLPSTSVNTEIEPGTDATFVLQADITNSQVSANANSTVQISLQNFSSLGNSTMSNAASHFSWLDKDNNKTLQFLWVEYADTTVKSTSYQS